MPWKSLGSHSTVWLRVSKNLVAPLTTCSVEGSSLQTFLNFYYGLPNVLWNNQLNNLVPDHLDI